MRMLVDFRMPLEPYNTYVRDGTIGERVVALFEHLSPDMVYFTERDGRRGGIMVLDVDTPDDIARIAEPFFLALNAEVRFHPCMSLDDLKKVGLKEMGQRWGFTGWG